jgi:hypothetical protein
VGSPVLARTLAVAAAVAVTLALVAGYVRRAAVDSDQFSNRATAALRDDSVRSLLARKITDEIVLSTGATCSPPGRSSSRSPPR